MENLQPKLEAAWVEVKALAKLGANLFNEACAGREAWEVALATVLFYIVISAILDFLFQEQSLFVRSKLALFRFLRKIPAFRNYVEGKLREPLAGIQHDMMKHAPHRRHPKMPAPGIPSKELLQLLHKEYENCGNPLDRLRDGKVSGTIYVGGTRFEELTKTLVEAYGMFAWTNPLHPGVFPGVRQMEAEVVSMTCDLFGGGPETCGAMTSGGTESILVAIRAYREWARNEKGITQPNIVAPRTAHPAFDKACEFFGISLRKIPENTITRRADVSAMRRAIDSNTIAIVGSCPQYPHGAVDPIEELAAIAKKKNIGMHVDCCLGSFLVCFMRKSGFNFPAFDFSVPGVTSISTDTHKFGMSPKGSSVVMYSSPKLRHYQYSVFTEWPGGIYGTPVIAGSRPGGLIAATWAALMFHGQDGYIANCKAIIGATRVLEQGIKSIKGLKLCCPADVSVVAWTSDTFDICRMVEPLTKDCGWDVNVLQFPASIHICLTMAHTQPGVVERLVRDLTAITAELMKNPNVKVSGAAAMYGTSQAVPDRSIIRDIVHGFLDATFMVSEESGKSKKD